MSRRSSAWSPNPGPYPTTRKTVTFKIREGRKFASGNPITAEDVVFSLQRLIKLDKTPAFIITQFGITKDNVDTVIKQTGDYEFSLTMDKPYATSFVLYCLTATVASVVDKKLAMEHEANGDFGYEWLKTNYAGSGPFMIREWRANEAVVLERNPNYSGTAAPLARVIYRHIAETATQRLLLEKGDIDIARNLGPEELDGRLLQSGHQDPVVGEGHALLLQPEPEEREPCKARSPRGDEVAGRL